jgi:adenylylsulfate kinase
LVAEVPTPVVVWLLGPTAAGKTTIAEALTRRLGERAVPVIHFDGDEVRGWFGPDLGFAATDRLRVVGTLARLADKCRAAGLYVVVSALTAHADARAYVRDHVENLVMAYVRCSLETCAARDPKGLYAQARRGEIDTLIGHDGDYAPPEHPDLILDSDAGSVDDLVAAAEEYLVAQGHFTDIGRRTALAPAAT